MTLHPEAMKRAQAEVDAVLGNKMPTNDDKADLPYTDALVKECLRWETVLPMGVAHVAAEDRIYGGYRIPKGAIIMPNAW